MNFVQSQPIHVLGGQSAASADPNTILMTVLGSCISACIYDPAAGIGGMNHFILPIGGDPETPDRRHRYGDFAMRMLVDDLCSLGAERPRLRAKLYGGRCRTAGGTDPGSMNAAFARQFLRDEGIRLVSASVGEDLARWIMFHPATGRVWLKVTAGNAASLSLNASGVLMRTAANA